MLGTVPDRVVSMDPRFTETSLSYGGLPPLLLAASSETAMRRARETGTASGLRIGAELGIGEAAERLKQQASASAIWIEVDQDCGQALDRLLDDVDDAVESRRFGAVLSLSSNMIDLVGDRLFDGGSHIVIDAGPVERLPRSPWRPRWRQLRNGPVTSRTPAPSGFASSATRSAGSPRRWRGCRPSPPLPRRSSASPARATFPTSPSKRCVR